MNLVEYLRRNRFASVCIVRSTDGIGDSLMLNPAVRELCSVYPQARITLAVHPTCMSFFKDIQVTVTDYKTVDKKQYDFVLDLTAAAIGMEISGSTVHRTDSYALAMGFRSLPVGRPLYTAATKPQLVSGPKVALHIGTTDEKRDWPLDQSLALINAMPDVHFYVFNALAVTTLPANATNCSSTTVDEMAGIIDACDMFVGPDSGPMHIAGALNKRSVVLFGAVPPAARIKYYPLHISIVSSVVSCLGCWHQVCANDFQCMKTIPLSTVVSLIRMYT